MLVLLEQGFPFNLRKKLRSPLLKCSRSKKSRTAPAALCTVQIQVDGTSPPASSDERMPLKKDMRSKSTENLSRHKISNEVRAEPATHKDDTHLRNLPLPLSLTLGITSLSDSKLYNYHNSQEFLTFLTQSARNVEEAERNHTIDTAISQMKELTDLVRDNIKLLRFVQNTQEYNPSAEIDDKIVRNIDNTLREHRSYVDKMCERAKEYKHQLILAESDLENNCSHEIKSDLQAMNKTLTWMSMIIRYHVWGSNVADESLYHSDDDVVHHRKLGRRNCIRVRARPKWCEETSVSNTSLHEVQNKPVSAAQPSTTPDKHVAPHRPLAVSHSFSRATKSKVKQTDVVIEKRSKR